MVTDNIQIMMNSDYGAPELKKTYQKSFSKGMIVAIVVHIFLICTYLLVNYINARADEKKNQNQQRIINVTDLEPPPSATDDEEPPPPKIEEPPVAPPKDLTALQPEPVAKEKAQEQTIKTQEELEQIKTPIGSDSGKMQYTGNLKVEEKKIEEKIEKKEEKVKDTYNAFEVEKAPECVNLAQVRASMQYPEIARQAGIEGRVTVKVLVGPDGNVIKVGSISGPEAFHDEVRDKSSNLQFTPGMQNGKPVKVWVTVPFNFKLKN